MPPRLGGGGRGGADCEDSRRGGRARRYLLRQAAALYFGPCFLSSHLEGKNSLSKGTREPAGCEHLKGQGFCFSLLSCGSLKKHRTILVFGKRRESMEV